MNRLLITRIGLFIGILVLLSTIYKAAGNISGSRNNQLPTLEGRPALSVSLENPQLKEWPLQKEVGGSIEARHEAIVSSQLSGVPVVSIRCQIGDKVKKGQVLAELDKDEITYSLEQSSAVLDEAKAVFDEANKNAKRSQKILQDNVLSATELSQYLTSARVAEARLKNARVQYAIQNLKLRHTKIIANEEGTIISSNILIGDMPSAGTELFHILGKDQYEWRAEMTVEELNEIPSNSAVIFDYPEAETLGMKGKLRVISPSIDSKLKNGIAYVDILDSPQNLKKGMYLRGRFILGIRSSLSIRKSALVLKDGYNLVYLVGNITNGLAQVEARKVLIGGQRQGEYEVLEGLSESDTYVISGGGLIEDGDLVRVVH